MIRIGKLQIDLEQREIRQDGAVLRVGSRALDILELLIRAEGALVPKDEIMRRVWPTSFVEENNLQVHVAALRKALGDDRDLIRTVPGRGYQLVPPRPVVSDTTRSARCCGARGLSANVPTLVGRDKEVSGIIKLLGEVVEVTLVGTGGIGKTSLAIRVAHQIGEQFRDGARFIELAALSEADAVLTAVAEICEVPFAGRLLSTGKIAEALAAQQGLIVLDNAEHVIDVVTELVGALVAHAPQLRILVTSREPLRLEGETLFRVQPLDVPEADAPLDEVPTHSAVMLFVCRARSVGLDPAVDAQSMRLVGGICRRLDGIALAIELAAARAATLGVEGVYCRLDDRLQLLTGGHRNSVPRHQTLRATFDWSYGLLDPVSRTVFRRLGVFVGAFTFDSICAVATDPDTPIGRVIASIDDLVDKSLLNVELTGAVAHYRLSESTRAYANDKLRDEGELQQIAARHTRYVRQCFEIGEHQAATQSGRGDASELHRFLDDARSAFDWAFASQGDRRLGVELAAALVGVLLECSLVEECCTRAECAVAAIEELPPLSIDAACEMRLRAALAATLLHTRGPVARSARLWHQVLLLAEQAGDDEFQARALWGLWNTMLACADIHTSLRYATRFQQFADKHGDSRQRILGDQLLAVSLHCFGEHAQARDRLEHALAQLATLRYEATPANRFAVDPLIFSNGTLARIAWLQGFPDQAMAQVETTVNLVRADALEPSLSQVLAVIAIPVALMAGDLQAAARYLEVLRSQVASYGFEVWRECCESLAAQLDILAGDAAQGLERLQTAIDALLARGFRRLLTPAIVLCAETLAATGRTVDASTRLSEALDYCTAHGEHFFVPEIWRAMGVVALSSAGLGSASGWSHERLEAQGERCLITAIDISQQQGARMWELRASLLLADIRSSQGRGAEALELLEALAVHFSANSPAMDIQALYARIGSLRGKPQRSGEHGQVDCSECVAEPSLPCQPPPSDLW